MARADHTINVTLDPTVTPLPDGDVLIVQANYTESGMRMLVLALEEAKKKRPDTTFIIVNGADEPLDITALDEAAMRAHGWQRIPKPIRPALPDDETLGHAPSVADLRYGMDPHDLP